MFDSLSFSLFPPIIIGFLCWVLLFTLSHLQFQLDFVLPSGFVFGPPIALALGVGFVMVRKPEKLPGTLVSQEYVKEYGKDVISIQKGTVSSSAGKPLRAMLIDDVLATGGTLVAAYELVTKAGGQVCGAVVVLEL